MSIEVKVPELGESIKEALIVEWLKSEGDAVKTDEPVALIETDKANLEIVAPASGRFSRTLKAKGEWALVGDVIAEIEEGAAGNAAPAAAAAGAAAGPASGGNAAAAGEARVMPAAQRVMTEGGLTAADVQATGPGGRILKEDALRAAAPKPAAAAAVPKPAAPQPRKAAPGPRGEEAVPMSPLRRTVARRLVEAQHQAALLTTFNEIDMTAVMALRKEHGEAFLKAHGIKLGMMSFFVKASVEALKRLPELNAEIRGDEIVYHNYYDVAIAIGGGKGLVVPALRNAELMSFAEVELAIADFGARAKENKLKLDELQGGTFTISNGGVYGSMLSTPIVNPPQSGILGLHAIQDRPVARDGQVVIRPMMFVALTYDHRIVDGREAVTFLRRVKDSLEQPARILLEI